MPRCVCNNINVSNFEAKCCVIPQVSETAPKVALDDVMAWTLIGRMSLWKT